MTQFVRPYLIGVDLGTSAVKTTLFDRAGQVMAHATQTIELYQSGPGVAEQDPDAFLAAALKTLRVVVDEAQVPPGDVAGIAFDGQMGGIMGVDGEFRPVTPWYPSTLDARYRPHLARVMAAHGEQVWQTNGAAPIVAPRLLWWQAEHPDLLRRVRKVVILANYVGARLAGLAVNDAFIDPSYLTWSGLADIAQRHWSEALVQVWQVDASVLPRIVPATSVIGGLNRDAASSTGLRAGTPLVAGAGDQVAGFLGAGLTDPGQLVDVSGTFGVLGLALDRPFIDPEQQMWQPLAGPISDDHWYALMYLSGSGLTHRWFADQCGQDVGGDLTRLDVEAAQLPPGSDGLLCAPHFGGRACPDDPHVRGAWIGLTWRHTRGHTYRALLESIAYDYAQALTVARARFPETAFTGVRAIGGGARSDAWNQIKADVLGLPVQRLALADRPALGCALMAGHAVGVYPDLGAAARAQVQPQATFHADPAHHEVYRKYVALYGDMYDTLRPLYRRLHGVVDEV